jgi:Zn-dependent M28 family amino/carboxypeptidase
MPHTGATHYEKDVPKIPVAALAIPDAEMLQRILAEGKPVRLSMTLTPRELPDAESANVVGEVIGSEAPGEIVLLGAHLDSWDLGTGAVDDGAGCAIVIEAGRMINALPKKPRRTIRVVLFANEENGLRGARTYAKEHEAEIEKHIVAMEADFGAGRVYGVKVLGGPQALPLLQKMAKPLSPLGVDVSPEPAYGGADISPLRALGVPVIDLQQDGSLYFDIHHTANDTLEQITKEDLDQAVAAFTTMAFLAADTHDDFGRIPEESRVRKRK